eukprot:CAMPEP_0198211204 /NCGR_PEP_ID=MMETSP1445-20131203/22686_1 /TAXON_ID=36898 /ORGANISM="Pyramimonas sp., Strain CCMP2087" /LENGTH=285 /DNA_ID=CAMNT_0043885417 /DNA_START=168 /DNA_END=1025 /DNA_ORIENTATION=+
MSTRASFSKQDHEQLSHHERAEAVEEDMPRSTLLRLATATAFLCLSTPPASAFVDEAYATRVYELANRSAVFIGDFSVDKDGKETSEGVGSGIIWDKGGHIVTNYHVVAKLAKDKSGKQIARVGVLGPDGKTYTNYDAQIVGMDAYTDLAVLKIDAPPDSLQPITVGTSSDLRVGQSCYAIGNPFGLGATLTAGLVSGLNRTIPSPAGRPITGAIQTDAAINAGNSGGPLLDSYGRLIGINSATFTRSGSGLSSGVNFALPVDLVYKSVLPMVTNYGMTQYPPKP